VTAANDTYNGNLKYGTHAGIPKDVPMPATLSDPGKQLFDALQTYGACIGDQGGGGFHLFPDQEVCANDAWYNNAANDLNKIIMPYLRPLRNQHLSGANWIDNPVNGPGKRLDTGPPPLRLLPGFPVPSPNNTVINTPTDPVITDSLGDKWSFNAAGAVTINGTVDASSSGVVQMAYVDGVIHVKNSSGSWYGKTARWGVYSAGSATSPLVASAATGTTTSATLPDGGVTYNFRVYAIGN
jgi:hypothetical protein